MILIVTDAHDEHVNVVASKIAKKGVAYFRLNLDVDSLRDTELSLIDDIWTVRQNSSTINSDQIECVWYRRAFVELLLEEKEDRSPDFLIWKGEWNKVLLGLYTSISHLPSLCPLKASYAAENKFLQQYYAKLIGFNQPQTITTNVKRQIEEFITTNNNNVVLKLHSQDFYKVGDDFKGIYVNKIDTNDLNDFGVCGENPITLQSYIEKKYEVRYTVVGDKHFCSLIDSQQSDKSKIDWRRYDLPNTPYRKVTPPDSIANGVNKLLENLGLNFGALDFIVDEKDEWYFLEVNPMGQWLWIEDLTGLDISGAITDWLIDSCAKEVKI